jgi:AcrR family transcriptional regulator
MMSPGSVPTDLHNLPREVVAKNQRERLLDGAARAFAARGYAEMTVEHVLAEAGISHTTFYENFENKRDCLRVAQEGAFDRLIGELSGACAAGFEWPDKLVAGIRAAIAFAIRDPERAQLLIVETVATDATLASGALASSDYLVGLLRKGREQHPKAVMLPELTERALVGAMVSVIGGRLLSGRADQLPELEPQLVQFLLMPYVGLGEARQIALETA